MAGLSNGVNLSPQHHERFESFTFYSGSGAAKDYLPSLIHFALDFDPFDGAKLRPSGRCVKRRSGSTLSKPRHYAGESKG